MSNGPIVLFDGVCNYCNTMINFVIRQDRAKLFRFAPLQSEGGQKLLEQFGLPKAGFNSFVLVEEGKAYFRSAAALRVMKHLPWYWAWTQVFRLVPRTLRDGVYDFIARNRYKWFGKKEQCMIPTPGIKSRFLD